MGAITNEQLVFLEAWRAVDRAYVDKTFNGQPWFKARNTLRSILLQAFTFPKRLAVAHPAAAPCASSILFEKAALVDVSYRNAVAGWPIISALCDENSPGESAFTTVNQNIPL